MSTQSTLLTSCGSTRCSLEELLEIPEPQQTDTYTPLNHYDFALNTLTIASDLLSGYEFTGDQYALANNGKQMFGVINYRDPNSEELSLAIGIANSYDKSRSCFLVAGRRVLVCSNYMMAGDIKIKRKHTGDNMHEDLNDRIVAALYKSQHSFTKLSNDAEAMKSIEMNQRAGFRYLGLLTGEGILRPTQSTTAFQEARDPSHDAFETKNLWRYYNAATAGLKSSAPSEHHRRIT